MTDSPATKGPRWWPAVTILVLGAGVTVWFRAHTGESYQVRNLQTLGTWLIVLALLYLWWVAASRTPWRLRLGVALAVAAAVGLGASVFRIRGVSGDLIPILEPRWAKAAPLAAPGTGPGPGAAVMAAFDYPQFLGPHRTAILDGPALKPDWGSNPPQVLWRQPIGAAWSGWAVVGARALTQEQRPEGEASTCYDALTGHLLWSHAEPAHYHTTIAGEGPRCTPTVVSNRVFTLGAIGILNCLDLETGRQLWSHDIVKDGHSHMPGWGFSGSPLAVDGLIVVSAGGEDGHSLLAYRRDTGQLAWAGGSRSASHASPVLATLAGRRQILAFNSRKISAHDPVTGQVLWEYPWGVGQPHVATPVVVGTNRVLFSSGYGVGSELLEIQPAADGSLKATRIWQTKRMKAKIANLVQRQGFLYGLDDGVLACLDLKDGSQTWEEGRYGHGQGLLVRDLYLLMAENGELILLEPTPKAPNEIARFRLFHGKTWNPIALAGDLLLARTDQEAACVRLPVEPAATAAR